HTSWFHISDTQHDSISLTHTHDSISHTHTHTHTHTHKHTHKHTHTHTHTHTNTHTRLHISHTQSTQKACQDRKSFFGHGSSEFTSLFVSPPFLSLSLSLLLSFLDPFLPLSH